MAGPMGNVISGLLELRGALGVPWEVVGKLEDRDPGRLSVAAAKGVQQFLQAPLKHDRCGPAARRHWARARLQLRNGSPVWINPGCCDRFHPPPGRTARLPLIVRTPGRCRTFPAEVPANLPGVC
ncbi:hypothetical protein DQ04_11321000 [Trypanosoma grayi]|uniref:hypothetical protein n=1 Tax=Trypanosoma grayi TaxID=71804 RepID=UPI0004F4A9A9|nr:hypothetical protein DQ04_11321000 [Trypanosoma grayi]KEG06997.1 hypothetical protein DQ04_11321000 [Trypanosoma grayi]